MTPAKCISQWGACVGGFFHNFFLPKGGGNDKKVRKKMQPKPNSLCMYFHAVMPWCAQKIRCQCTLIFDVYYRIILYVHFLKHAKERLAKSYIITKWFLLSAIGVQNYALLFYVIFLKKEASAGPDIQNCAKCITQSKNLFCFLKRNKERGKYRFAINCFLVKLILSLILIASD